MYKNLDSSKPYFWGVAMFLIIAGALLLAVGLVEWLMSWLGGPTYADLTLKVVGGLVVLALGYIHLELELLRLKKS